MSKKAVKEINEEDAEKKSILTVDYNDGFRVDCYNMLETPKIMHFNKLGFNKINVNLSRAVDGDDVDETTNKILDPKQIIENKTKLIIVLRYFEYLCIATVRFEYIMEILRGGFSLIDGIDMIKHHLKNKLVREVKGTEQIIEMHIEYRGYVKYE